MTIFVDTGVLYAAADEDAPRHREATAGLTAVLDGRHGQPSTSDYVFDEVVTLATMRTGRPEHARRVGDRILGVGDYPDVFVIYSVTDDVFERARELLDAHPDHLLSFTDATTLALVERHDIDTLLSFDDDFDGLVERIDPISA